MTQLESRPTTGLKPYPSASVAYSIDQRYFLRDAIAKVSERAAGRPIAIYGAGRHTFFLLDVLRRCANAPTVRFILDDDPDRIGSVGDIPVLSPARANADDVALIVVSSDTIEAQLASRAEEWIANQSRAGHPGERPHVVRLYGEDPAGVVKAHNEQFRGVWGQQSIHSTDHLPLQPGRRVLRLPATTSNEAPTKARSDYPLPPSALRAGYSTENDAEYLASGVRDVNAIRGMIERHSPEFRPRRVLDWGCSTGRLIRHWSDITASGGEVWGTDLCANALNWACEHLSPPFRFFPCTTRPHLPVPDSSFDLIYANSVFTHIRDLWDAWLMELRRVVRPGGLVFATILDEESWAWIGRSPGNGIARRCPEIDFSAALTDDFVAHSTAADVVSFWHTQGVRRRWSFAFDVLAIEAGTVPYQTGVLLRRPSR